MESSKVLETASKLFEAFGLSFSAKVAPDGLNRGTTCCDLVSKSEDGSKSSYEQARRGYAKVSNS